ncbi:MAG TPA: tRNA (adenosine(37)-N6)-threonylcarbamoyltransferase complex dimerization subunit type 1 TsaB [bacterium]|nr:tRNA (adenosine(37)-N6)-threonylcarbamoyltransferase complex dimerization subunit type 1 TsaB [bacterium]
MLAAIEVSTRISSIALLDLITGEELGECALPNDWESSVTLVPALETLLKEKDLGPADLAAVAVSTGPGSFTGIRVGIATAEGLCMPSNLLAFGISTLEGLAENLRLGEMLGEALCLVDAQRGECFVGHYDIQVDQAKELTPPQILPVGQFYTLVKGKTWVVGPGALKYEREIRESMGATGMFAFNSLHPPKAMSIARLAYREWQDGLRPALKDLAPLYLRPPAVDEKK